jgi:hypothetical protein
MTDEEKLKFWQKYKGKEVEVSNNENFCTYSTILLHCMKNYCDKHGDQCSEFISNDGTWYIYARPIQKKTRLMTVDELDGKWISWDEKKDELSKIRLIDKKGGFAVYSSYFGSVEDLQKRGGKWTDKPNFDNLRSLEVDA